MRLSVASVIVSQVLRLVHLGQGGNEGEGLAQVRPVAVTENDYVFCCSDMSGGESNDGDADVEAVQDIAALSVAEGRDDDGPIGDNFSLILGLGEGIG